MPKFSDNEKEAIRGRLFIEGERLFALHGIKKVTVDELARAAGIAKGSFYAFYPGKEHLYMDIAAHLQDKIWEEMEGFLEENRSLPPREMVKRCFMMMFDRIEKYPMLKQTDGETTDYLFRKLPPEIIEAHTRDDSRELLKLRKYGVHFTCRMDRAAKIMQLLAIAFLSLPREDKAGSKAIMETMLDGVLKEIVDDQRN